MAVCYTVYQLYVISSCAGIRTICPRPCTPHTAAQLQPIHACAAPSAMNTHDRQAAACSGRWRRNWYPYKLCSDLNSQPKRPRDHWSLTLKVVSIVTCANFGFPKPLCSRLRPDVRDRQTEVRQKHRLMPPPIRGGGIIRAVLTCKPQSVCVYEVKFWMFSIDPVCYLAVLCFLRVLVYCIWLSVAVQLRRLSQVSNKRQSPVHALRPTVSALKNL